MEGWLVPVLYVPHGTVETCGGGGQPPQGNLMGFLGVLLCAQTIYSVGSGTGLKAAALTPKSQRPALLPWGWWCTQLGSVRGWTSACISHCQAPCQECPLSWVMTLTYVVAGAVTVVTGVEGEDGGSGAV